MRGVETRRRGQALAALPRGEQILDRLAERFDLGEIDRARGALQTVRGPEHRFDQLLLRFGGSGLLQLQQSLADFLQMLRGFDFEGRAQAAQELFVRGGQMA